MKKKITKFIRAVRENSYTVTVLCLIVFMIISIGIIILTDCVAKNRINKETTETIKDSIGALTPIETLTEDKLFYILESTEEVITEASYEETTAEVYYEEEETYEEYIESTYKIEYYEPETVGIVDGEDVYYVAQALYGISEYDVSKCLKLISYEGYGADPYLDYLMACTCVNRLVFYPGCELYSFWGGGDGSYGTWMDGLGIADHAYSALYEALMNPNWDAWDCHGMCPENGYWSGQYLEDAIYVTTLNGMYFAVWPSWAGWY